MFKRNMFKAFLLSILCASSFCGSVMNAASSTTPSFSVGDQEKIKQTGALLRRAASNNGSDLIESLFSMCLSHRADIELIYACVQDADPETGYTAFTCASLKGDIKALKALAEPFKGRIELLKKIVMTYTNNFNTALIMAAYEGKVDVVRAILELFKEDKKSLKDVVMQQYNSRETALSKASLGGAY